MPDEWKYDELSASIDSIILRGEFTSTGDEELDALARIASGLRGLPSPEFKAQLVAELLPQVSQQLTVGSYATFRAVGSGTTRILAPIEGDGRPAVGRPAGRGLVEGLVAKLGVEAGPRQVEGAKVGLAHCRGGKAAGVEGAACTVQVLVR